MSASYICVFLTSLAESVSTHLCAIGRRAQRNSLSRGRERAGVRVFAMVDARPNCNEKTRFSRTLQVRFWRAKRDREHPHPHPSPLPPAGEGTLLVHCCPCPKHSQSMCRYRCCGRRESCTCTCRSTSTLTRGGNRKALASRHESLFVAASCLLHSLAGNGCLACSGLN